MKIDKTPGKKFDDDSDTELDEQEERGPKIIKPQTFPSTPAPLPPGPKILGKRKIFPISLRLTGKVREQLAELRQLKFIVKKRND